jgi:preprotein translocase subunit SecF
MIELRAKVYAADQSNTNIQGSLEALQAYVTAHMNTNLSAGPDPVYPPIQLKYTYARLVQEQSEAVQQTNAQLYTAAQQYCQTLDPTDFSGHNRVPCIEQYVETHNAVAQPIPDSLYEFDFISPTWSPDLAGWSLVASILAAILFVVSFIFTRWFKREVA